MGQQLAGNGHMRALPDPGRCIAGLDIREQEQHQQRAATAFDIDPPLHEVGAVAEAHVHMPVIVAGGDGRGEADREAAEALRRKPAPRPGKLVIGPVQQRGVGGLDEGGRGHRCDPDDGSRPALGPVGREARSCPQLVPALPGEVGGEGAVDPDEAVLDEALDLMLGQAGGFGIGHHAFSAWRPNCGAVSIRWRESAGGRAGQISGKNMDMNIMVGI